MLPFQSPRLTFRSCLAYIATFCVVASFIGYAFFQARFLIAGPQIEIFTQDHTVQETRVVTLEGRAGNIVAITLNGRAIYTDESGYFKETVVLENGYTIATLRAEDRYGRVASKARTFVYTGAKLSDNS